MHGTMVTFAQLISRIMSVNMSYFSSILLISPLSAQHKLLPLVIKQKNSNKLAAKFLLFLLTLNFPIWNINKNQEKMAVLERCIFHWFQIFIKLFQKIMDVFVSRKVYRTELPTLLIQKELSDNLQLMTCQLEEIQINF